MPKESRYSLYAEDKKTGKRQLIKVKEMGDNGLESYKEKVYLSTIDKYTLYFSNDNALSDLLYKNNIIPFEDAKFYIEYLSKKTPIQIPVAYKELQQLQYFATNAPVKVSVVDPRYIQTVNQFLNSCLNKEFLDYQIKKGFLHEYNTDYALEYVRLVKEDGSPRQIDSLRSVLYTELNRYKRIRGIIVGTSQYYKSLMEQPDEIEIIDDGIDLDSIYFGLGYPEDRLVDQKRIRLVNKESN